MADSVVARRRTGRRWLWIVAGVAAIGAVCAVVGIWHLPDRMYPGTYAEVGEARAALQAGLLTAAAALTAVAGGLIALDETRHANAEVRRANANTHVRELYATAIGLLSADDIDSRLGGIYALERIARDSAADHRIVVEVLSAFLREHTQPASVLEQRPPPGRRWRHPPVGAGGDDEGRVRLRTDMHAAFAVLGRLPVRPGAPPADLTGLHLGAADLADVQLTGADLTGAQLAGANLTNAWLSGANLTRAHLDGAVLTDARLDRADLTRARLGGADLTRAWLQHANLTRAQLGGANVTDARLVGTDLTGARLDGANLTRTWLDGANLTGARLEGAKLVNAWLERANLIGARLIGADLDGAWLNGVDLLGAWLNGADLARVVGLSQSQLDEARGNDETRIPDGLVRPESWTSGDGSGG
ncbi:pentapeptide repeat protein [Parafrankia sp. EAN1pec]|uniref:pentapeptide repeat-containing protein n=1 Tax=Parafrankia sp. (strain EAN1pec) TaxID=298653 RepID=UPI0000540E03|nr:pentapeptide repeat protein [Frankia sp. EAN1pec]